MLFLASLLSAWQIVGPPAQCQGRLETHFQAGTLTVTGLCRNLTDIPVHYRYELSLRHASNGSLSQNTQRGEFVANSQQEVLLSQTQMNAGSSDQYRIYLRIYNLAGNTLVQDSIVHTSSH